MPQNFAATDPLISLGKLWDDIRGEIAKEDSDAVIHSLSDRLGEIEKQMIPLVATSALGLAAQLRVLRTGVTDDYAALVDSVLAGVRLLLP